MWPVDIFQVCSLMQPVLLQETTMAKQPQLRMYKQYSPLVTVGRGRPRFSLNLSHVRPLFYALCRILGRFDNCYITPVISDV